MSSEESSTLFARWQECLSRIKKIEDEIRQARDTLYVTRCCLNRLEDALSAVGRGLND